MGLAGFILALIALVGGFIVSGIAVVSAGLTGGGMGLVIGWTVFAAITVGLSVMGMNKSKAAGHKAGLAIAGLAIGAVALIYGAYACYAVHVAQSLNSGLGNVMDALHSMGDSLKNVMDTMGGH
jgi:hypothetical protein